MHTRTRPRASSTNTRERPIAPAISARPQVFGRFTPAAMSFTEKKSAQAKPPRRARRAPGHRTHAAEPGDETAADEKSATSRCHHPSIYLHIIILTYIKVMHKHMLIALSRLLLPTCSSIGARLLVMLLVHTYKSRPLPSFALLLAEGGERERERGGAYIYITHPASAAPHAVEEPPTGLPLRPASGAPPARLVSRWPVKPPRRPPPPCERAAPAARPAPGPQTPAAARP
jgi:hypothetical protein